LIKAFQATLKESSEADLLLHVVDAADIARDENMTHVDSVLEEIGANEVPTLKVFNKIDALPTGEPRIDRDADGNPYRVWLSARDGRGLDLLKQAIAELLAVDVFNETLTLPNKYGRLRAMLFEQGAVKTERFDEEGRSILEVKLPKKDYLQILARAGMSEEQIVAA